MLQGLIGLLTIFVIGVISYFINKNIRGPYLDTDTEDEIEVLGDDIEVCQEDKHEDFTTPEGEHLEGTIKASVNFEVVNTNDTDKDKTVEEKKYTPKRRGRKPYKKSTKHKND